MWVFRVVIGLVVPAVWEALGVIRLLDLAAVTALVVFVRYVGLGG